MIKCNNLFSYNSILLLLILIFVILNFCIFKNSVLITLNNIILIILYFVLLKKNKKYKKFVLVTILHFSFWGPIIESLLIKYTKLLKYKHTDINNNIPYWLPSAYSLFALVTLHSFDFFKNNLV